jgi:hypothetical protein
MILTNKALIFKKSKIWLLILPTKRVIRKKSKEIWRLKLLSCMLTLLNREKLCRRKKKNILKSKNKTSRKRWKLITKKTKFRIWKRMQETRNRSMNKSIN